ncbi:hypothetical protein YC2023_073640 [Brassica napus]
MQPDIWKEWWRPASVLDIQPDMWSTRCRCACVRSHAKRHTGCHQPEADWLSAPRECSVQLKVNQMKIISDENQMKIISDENQVNRKRERSKVVDLECSRFSPRRPVPSDRRFSTIVTRKLCPIQYVQASIFSYNQVEVMSKISSVPLEVLLDAPPESPKNCPEAKGGSVRVQISLAKPVSFYMVKPRLCPSQDQSNQVVPWVLASYVQVKISPVKSSQVKILSATAQAFQSTSKSSPLSSDLFRHLQIRWRFEIHRYSLVDCGESTSATINIPCYLLSVIALIEIILSSAASNLNKICNCISISSNADALTFQLAASDSVIDISYTKETFLQLSIFLTLKKQIYISKQYLIRSICGITTLKKLNLGIKKD